MSKHDKIVELNDLLRTSGIGGSIFLSRGIADLEPALQSAIVNAVREFDDFTEDNDPYGEHDFGSVTVSGHKVFWKIDYYDLSVKMHSPDPSDPKVTTRVLVILLAEEY